MRLVKYSLWIYWSYLMCLCSCSSIKSQSVELEMHKVHSSAGVLSPQQFGAIANDEAADDRAFQQMMDHYEKSKQAFTIKIPPGIYIFKNPVEIPTTSATGLLYIEGYGAEIQLDGASHGFVQKGNGKNISNNRPIIKGITFTGNGGTGIKLRGTYTAEIDQCHFIGLDTGLVSLFSLNGSYTNLRFTNNKKISFYGAYGDWPGASKTNSCFNANLIRNCRVFGGAGQIAHFEIRAGDNNSIHNCISEGKAPRYNVLIDSENATVVNHFIDVENFWIESKAYNERAGSTYFELRNIRGLSRLEDVQAYPGKQMDTLINNTHSQSHTTILMDGYSGSTHLINNGGSQYGSYYIFRNTPARPEGSFPHSDPSNWVGNVVPRAVIEEQYRSQNTGQFRVSDRVYRSSKND